MHHPLRSLRESSWFKLICGASFQHLPAIRNLTLAYALAGADCIDVAADLAVITAAREALDAAQALTQAARGQGFRASHLPWLMVSLNDGEDPHFRKATFEPDICPSDCLRPCERICPADAIVFTASHLQQGVIDSRCYGCGRCLPVCPIQQITTRSYVSTPAAIAPLVLAGVDAVEIHTQVGRLADFERLWQAIAPYLSQLKLVAISCPEGEGLIDYLWSLYDLISPLPCPLIWQTDGRPMSGDIGQGTTRAAVRLGQKVLAAGPPGYVQLAGGTNAHTVAKLRSLALLPSDVPLYEPLYEDEDVTHEFARSGRSCHFISGVAYGSYARALLAPVFGQLEEVNFNETITITSYPVSLALPQTPDLTIATATLPTLYSRPVHLEQVPHLMWQAVDLAHSLISQLKPSSGLAANRP